VAWPRRCSEFGETRDEASLPRGLDRVSVVVAAHVADRVAGCDAIQNHKTRKRGSGAPASAAAGDLDASCQRELPDLVQRVAYVIGSAGSHQSRQRTHRDGHTVLGGGVACR
jgi:hypothetical protein